VELLSWVLALALGVGAWPGEGGGARRSGVVPDATGRLQLESAQSLKVGKSALQTPLLTAGLLVAWSGDGVVRAWRLPGLKEMWDEKWGRAPVNCWAEGEWLVVSIGHPESAVLGVDLQSGETRWRAKDVDASCPPLVAGGVAVVGTRSGEIAAFRLFDGRELWRAGISARALSGLAVVRRRLVATALDGEVVCMDEGEVLWRQSLDGNCYGGPAVSGDTVVCTTFEGQVAAFNRQGDVLWSRSIDRPVRSRACVGKGMAIVAAEDGVIVAMRLSDGVSLWEQSVDGVLPSAPTVVGETVVVGSLQGKGWLLDRRSGSVRDSVEVDGGIRSQPAVGAGLVAWCSDDGRVNVWKIAGQPGHG
jgi:outer membrane protein assembly factor BamB